MQSCCQQVAYEEIFRCRATHVRPRSVGSQLHSWPTLLLSAEAARQCACALSSYLPCRLAGLSLLIESACLPTWPCLPARLSDLQAVPIAFLALLYHDLVPVICAYLGHDRAAVRCGRNVAASCPWVEWFLRACSGREGCLWGGCFSAR
jgi:hypothetical protein